MIHIRPPDGAISSVTAEVQRLRDVSEKMEAAFLTEMLKHAGLGETESEFGGGHGEAQFASFLREEHAKSLVSGGGIGLSEQIFKALLERQNG